MSTLSKIRTDYWAKPMPDRRCDWSATYDDYEGGDGYDEPAGPIGYGRTEADAVIDLIENHPRGVQCERDLCCTTCGAPLHGSDTLACGKLLFGEACAVAS